MLRLLLAAFLSFGLAAPGFAQNVLASYSAMIGPADRSNSRGVPLNGVCAMVQQDRANVHRFGIIDSYDQYDPVFGTRNMRAQIPSLCQVYHGGEFSAAIQRGTPFPVYVEILGNGNYVSQVRVYYGAG